MCPTVFGIPFLHTYGLMIAIGFLVGLHCVRRNAAKVGVNPDDLTDLAFFTLFAGIAGTRVMHIIMFPDNYSWNDPIGWIAVWRGGLVFQGAIIPAVLVAYFGLKWKKIPFWPVVDMAIPYLALGQAFGRIGCFCNGCCFGHRADHFPLALRFPHGSPVFATQLQECSDLKLTDAWSFPVHPTQLYESAGLFAIFAILILLRKKWNPFEGFEMPCYLALCGILRFFVEFARADGNPTGLGFGYLSDQQIFSIAMVLIGIGMYLWLQRRARKVTRD